MLREVYDESLKPYVGPYLEILRVHINESCRGLESWQVIAFTFGVTMVLMWTWSFLFKPDKCKTIILNSY